MNFDPPKPLESEHLRVENGTIYVGGEPIESHEILEEIARGASGIVYLARNRVLDRLEALKVWVKLRDDDQRDKQIQGLKEAQKLAKVNGKNSVQIFDAHILKHAVIATMEYVPSVTLRDFAKKCTTFGEVLGLGYAYLTLIETTTAPETLHGDPHGDNVLVCEEKMDYKVSYTLKLCDYGTSAFNPSGCSLQRHWKTVWLTLVDITKRLPGSSEARKAVEDLREESIANFKKMAERPDLFSAQDMARALTACMRDYLDFWDVVWHSAPTSLLEPAPDKA